MKATSEYLQILKSYKALKAVQYGTIQQVYSELFSCFIPNFSKNRQKSLQRQRGL